MIAAVVQARMGATRLPGKVLTLLAGQRLLDFVLAATERAADRDWRLILATTRSSEDDAIAEHMASYGSWDVWRGATCPLQRFQQIASAYELAGADILMRVTADDPFKVPALMALAVDALREYVGSGGDARYVKADTNHGQYQGLGAEAFTVSALRWASEITPPNEREHVTKRLVALPLAPVTFSVDTPEDVTRWERYAA